MSVAVRGARSSTLRRSDCASWRMLFPTLFRSDLLKLSPLANAFWAVNETENRFSRFGHSGIAHGDLLTGAEGGSRRSPERAREAP